ncbi:hypothetical protein EI291_22235, partial [Hymenobacter rigui]
MSSTSTSIPSFAGGLLSGLSARIKGSPRLKQLASWLLFQPRRARPRIWVRWLANPLVHRYAPGSLVRRARRDLIPFHAFELGRHAILEDQVTVAN